MAKKIIKAKIADLKVNLFVRTVLDPDHVMTLALLIEGGVTLDPIQITADMTVVDGRHRIEAYDVNKISEIEAEIVEIKDEATLIAHAYRANTGGAKPPTMADTEHTIALLLDRGGSVAKIADLLGLPASMTRKLINTIRSKQKRVKIQRAIEAVSEGGLTVVKAAENYGVDPKDLKEAISGHRKKKNVEGIVELHRKLTFRYKSSSSENAATMRNILEKFEDGDVKESQVREIIKHLEDLQAKQARALADWVKRFEAKVGKPAKVA